VPENRDPTGENEIFNGFDRGVHFTATRVSAFLHNRSLSFLELCMSSGSSMDKVEVFEDFCKALGDFCGMRKNDHGQEVIVWQEPDYESFFAF
jgi:hypothetical protein